METVKNSVHALNLL